VRSKCLAGFIGWLLLASLILSTNVHGTEKKMGENTNINGGEEIAVVSTKHGEMIIKFFPDIAPGHVQNFKKLAKDGFYDGTIFHRVIPGFMIQGGDPTTKDQSAKGRYGTGGPGYNIDAEFSDKTHSRGIVSMARSSDPNSAGSQFFIMVNDSSFLDGQYSVFGEVIKGMEVADKIVSEPRDGNDNPDERIEMNISISVQ